MRQRQPENRFGFSGCLNHPATQEKEKT